MILKKIEPPVIKPSQVGTQSACLVNFYHTSIEFPLLEIKMQKKSKDLNSV